MGRANDDEVLQTERLLLRRWRPGDLAIVAPHYADPEVMVFIPGGAWTLETTEKVIARMTERELLNGFGYYPLVRRDDDRIVGHCGLARLEETGEIEVGYLLNRPYWAFGYATEIASAAIAHAFRLEIADRIVAVAFPENHRSITVMQRVGMHRVGPAQHFGVTLEKYAIRR